ncbi:MAG: hypothetical protein J5762_07095 [Clostridia bacterium]|nr:hypothetical protein [Clostridia bacterium]
MAYKVSEKVKKILFITGMVVLISCIVATPVLAWFYSQRMLAAYAPLSSPESLYIGAGHWDEETGHFEDIRYLYFDAVDAKDDAEGGGSHWDRVFCVYGKMVSGYRLQLSFTTNNQFTYEIYPATESLPSTSLTPEQIEDLVDDGAVLYTTHETTPRNFYYTIKDVDDGAGGTEKAAKLLGHYLNKAEVGEILANSAMHTSTYSTYSNVHKYAEPLYWQTNNVERGNIKGDFVNYYILRIHSDGEISIDRETDVICLSAKSFSS